MQGGLRRQRPGTGRSQVAILNRKAERLYGLVRRPSESMMMASNWHYARDGQRFGPFSSAQLQQLAAAKRLLPTDTVWREGMQGWQPAASIKGLFPAQATEDGAQPGPRRRGSPSPQKPGRSRDPKPSPAAYALPQLRPNEVARRNATTTLPAFQVLHSRRRLRPRGGAGRGRRRHARRRRVQRRNDGEGRRPRLGLATERGATRKGNAGFQSLVPHQG